MKKIILCVVITFLFIRLYDFLIETSKRTKHANASNKISTGMTIRDVLVTMGPPDEIKAGSNLTFVYQAPPVFISTCVIDFDSNYHVSAIQRSK